MIDIDSESFLAVVVAGALAAFLAGLVSTRMPLPVVVLEVLLGILIGPDVLGFAESDEFLNFFSNLGLGMLFFFAGYEIDFERIRGSPLRLAVVGWLLSLVLAYSLGGLLTLTGLVLSLLFTGSALATTAIGTLIPVLSDAGELRTRFGTYLLAAGAVGEFGPILLITLVFSTKGAATNAVILAAFIVVAVVAAVMAVRGVGRGWALLDRSLETSGQLAIRLAVVMVFALGALAASLGLDLLLGGFVAGVIARIALKGREVEVLESKLSAVGYGFLIPFFFVVSGVKFDLAALTDDPIRLLELPLFLGLFLIVRGTPAMLLYRGVLGFPGSSRPGGLLRHRPTADRRDHHDRGRGGPHALLHRRRPRRRGHPLHGDPAHRRPAPASRAPAGRRPPPGGARGVAGDRHSASSWPEGRRPRMVEGPGFLPGALALALLRRDGQFKPRYPARPGRGSDAYLMPPGPRRSRRSSRPCPCFTTVLACRSTTRSAVRRRGRWTRTRPPSGRPYGAGGGWVRSAFSQRATALDIRRPGRSARLALPKRPLQVHVSPPANFSADPKVFNGRCRGTGRAESTIGGVMAEPVPAGSDVSAGTYQCTDCDNQLQVSSTQSLPPCPNCGNGEWTTVSGGDSTQDPYPDN